MRKLIVLFTLFFSLTSLFAQNKLDEAIVCFNKCDYACAIKKFDEAKKVAVDKDKIKAEMGLNKAINCNKWLRAANIAFDNHKFNEAKDLYGMVLESNPKDAYAKSQLDKCVLYLTPATVTLNVSKLSSSFSASGGNESISVSTNSSSYSINLLPAWCSVQKYSNYFVLTCYQNNGRTSRNDYFTVTAGDKSVNVYINQTGFSNSEAITLSVSNDYIYFETTGGKSESIKVISNASTYSVSMIPSWCSVQTFKTYFVVTCNPNSNSQNRSDWFYVNAADKRLKVNIYQSGTPTNIKTDKYKDTKPAILYMGVGALKPMVFKADGKTFANMDYGYSFTIGIVKTLGLYVKINTNFSSTVSDYTLSNLPNTYYGITNTNYNSTFNRFGIVGGLMLNVKPIILYVGAGTGNYYHYIKTDLYNYLDDNFAKTINLTTISYSGIETDAGIIINFNKVGLSFGVTSVQFKYMELNLGLGIQL